MIYRYELEKGGLKYICPACHQMRFVRYVDTETGEHLSEDCGRCDREDSCGYHLRPSEWFYMTGKQPFKSGSILPKREPAPEPEPSFIDTETANKSLQGYERNNFARWLCNVLGEETAFQLVDTYRVGTSKHWPGACVFWQQDITGRIRSGKIMLYNAETGRRVKEPFNHTNWVHKVLNIEPFHLKQCLFGEHLLIREEKPVALVESEKTAIVAAGFMPDYTWLALGGKRGNTDRTREALRVLRNRRVTLFPDLGAFDKWSEIAKEMPGFTVSDILERRATDTDRGAGLDLADYLLRESEQAVTA